MFTFFGCCNVYLLYLHTMEYDNCKEAPSRVPMYLLGLLVLCLLVWIFYFRAEHYSGPAGPIIEAIQRNEKRMGTFMDFRKLVNMPDFSPTKYTQLVALHRDNKLNVAAVEKIMRS